MTYAKVEMRPPTLTDFNLALAEANSLIAEGFLDAIVTLEVLAWFFVGEIIGRRSIIGYSRVPGGYIKALVISFSLNNY
ncbi:unnamed protein product [Echinostoma caproni]|uniref:MFS transporter n=1 Tax=Echinostoma caproni TaxID=27848 RepID=A0A183AKV2_9TREM|nr:unnamed protein product [Echinostoma caproni]